MDRPTVVVRWAHVNQADDASSLAHRLALLASATVLAVPPQTLALGHRCPRCGSRDHGTPHVIGHAVQVSLARTRGAVVAVATSHAAVRGLGIDVEAHTHGPQDPGLEGLASVVLSPTEIVSRDRGHHPGHHPGHRRSHADAHPELRVWVRKEAILKALGTGLATDPASITLAGTTLVNGPQGPWWVEDLPLADGLLATVAVRFVVGVSDVGADVLSLRVDGGAARDAD